MLMRATLYEDQHQNPPRIEFADFLCLLNFGGFLTRGQFRDQKSRDLHEKSRDLSNYEIKMFSVA